MLYTNGEFTSVGTCIHLYIHKIVTIMRMRLRIQSLRDLHRVKKAGGVFVWGTQHFTNYAVNCLSSACVSIIKLIGVYKYLT